MAASLLPDSTSCFFLALSPFFFLRFLSCSPTFRVPPLKFNVESDEKRMGLNGGPDGPFGRRRVAFVGPKPLHRCMV